jgi:glutamate N-acetyltransferase / amino-acid N-acetyltransferase
MKNIPSGFRVPGFKAAGIAAGIKKNRQKDFALVYSEVPAIAAGVFTTNRVKAAPVLLSMERIKSGRGRAVLINSGCANACTGKEGLADARSLSRALAARMKILEKEIFLASTGVIGKRLPAEGMEKNLPALLSACSAEGLQDAARAIMTTDTHPKAAVLRKTINGREVTIAGMAKGAGMISPNMATLLAFVFTDACISGRALRSSLREGAGLSFNRVTIDGDMSTNDTLLVLANGAARNREILPGTPGHRKFSSELNRVLLDLARMVARDGEGATKLVEVVVEKARTKGDAEKIARSVANSPLVKTAFFGEDANWGRILCAAGYSGATLDPDRVEILFDDIAIVRRGRSTGPREEEKASAIMKKREYRVRVILHQGAESASLLTTDLSYDYVKINGSYRS